MTNILYVIWSLGLGGAEQVVINLARGLDKSRFRPFVACLNDEGRFADELKKEGISIFALNKKRGVDLSVVPKLVEIIKENDIRIVHTHLWGANFWGRWAARAAGVPVIIATEHGIQEYRTPLHFLLDRLLSRYTDKVVFVSETVRQAYGKKLCGDLRKTALILNGVKLASSDDPDGVSIRKEFHIAENETLISCVGRLSEEKGQKYILEAMAGFGLSNVKLLIVGDGPLLESLKSQAAGYKLGNKVIFAGFRKDVRAILKASDIVVLPSKREALSLVMLEAMALAKPVVATDVGDASRVIRDGINGFLIPVADKIALKEALSLVLGNKERMAEIGQQARETIEKDYSAETMIQRHQKLYEELLTLKAR